MVNNTPKSGEFRLRKKSRTDSKMSRSFRRTAVKSSYLGPGWNIGMLKKKKNIINISHSSAMI